MTDAALRAERPSISRNLVTVFMPYQMTMAQMRAKGKTARPRYSQVRYASASLGRMNTCTASQRHTENPGLFGSDHQVSRMPTRNFRFEDWRRARSPQSGSR